MEKTDRRVKMTRDMLKTALISLLKTKSLLNITIKEICDEAQMNRSTFYRHYQSVYDVYNDMVDDVLNDISFIIKSARANGTLYKYHVFEAILNYAERNRDRFLALLSDNSSMGFGKVIIDNADRLIGLDEQTDFTRYVGQFISAGITSIVWRWLNDENRLSPHNLALVVSALVNSGLRRAILFNREDPEKPASKN